MCNIRIIRRKRRKAEKCEELKKQKFMNVKFQISLLITIVNRVNFLCKDSYHFSVIGSTKNNFISMEPIFRFVFSFKVRFKKCWELAIKEEYWY